MNATTGTPVPDGHDSCRPVTLPSGETIRMRGAGEMSPEAAAALGEIVEAARRKMAVEHPENPDAVALWHRLLGTADARGVRLRDAATESGVRPWVLLRIAQGIMPDRDALAAIENWLTNGDENEGEA